MSMMKSLPISTKLSKIIATDTALSVGFLVGLARVVVVGSAGGRLAVRPV